MAPAQAAYSISQYSQVQHCVFLGIPVHVLSSSLPLHLRVDAGWPRREVSLRYGSHGRDCVSLQPFSEPVSTCASCLLIFHCLLCSAVYYNPAKTLGGMIESDIYCVMGLGFASFISLGSMYMYWTLEPHAGWEWLADALVLIWIGVGMSMVAWFKLWIKKPTFNPGQTT